MIVVFLGMAIIGSVSYFFQKQADEKLKTVYRDNLIPVQRLSQFRINQEKQLVNLYRIIALGDSSAVQEFIKQQSALVDANHKLWLEYKTSKLELFEEEIVLKVEKAREESRALGERVYSLLQEGKMQEAQTYLEANSAIYQKFFGYLDSLIEFNTTLAEQTKTRNEADFRQAIRIALLLTVLMIGLVILIGLVIILSVTKPMERLIEKRTQEISAANEELNAMNEELSATNEAVTEANQLLAEKDNANQGLLNELVLQKSQLRATIGLMTEPGEDVDTLLRSILDSAQELVKAQGAHAGLYDKTKQLFTVKHARGILKPLRSQSFASDQGMFGVLLQRGKLVKTEDYCTYEHRHADIFLDNVHTLIMFPLKVQGSIVGAFAVAWTDRAHPLRQEESDILQQFCDLASFAVERAMTLSSLAEKSRLLEKLAQMTESLMNDGDADVMLQRALVEAADLAGMRHGFIQLFDPDDGLLYHRYTLGYYDEKAGAPVNISGITAKVIQSGDILYVQDYHNWPERGQGGHLDDIKTSMQAPLIVDGKVTGMIGLSAMDRVVAISPEQMAILKQYAHIAAITIKNAQAYKEIEFIALHDSLTGLANRANLHQRLEKELNLVRSGGRCGCLMFIDLDDLKSINDVFGHTAGDQLLVYAGENIAAACGEHAIVGRIGGDEFVAILQGEEACSRIEMVAGKLIEYLGREYEYMGQYFKIEASIGIARYPEDADSVDDILRKSDIAMYAAKKAGKNCWRFFEPEMQQETLERVILTNSLRHALEKDELYLNYQPQLSLTDGKIVGFEALLRWRSSEHGAVSPDRFIPLAESSGLILPIGRWVMQEACRFASNLCATGRADLHVAVNISPKQLGTLNFVEDVRQLIAEAGIKPCQLELEITENVLIDSLEESVGKLEEFNRLGVHLSLDDFGTGYSSLTYLRNLPIGTLKIDKRFVDDVGRDRQQDKFVRLIIDMARMMNLFTIAEGVETEAQLQRLKELRCDCVQGYVFSKPLPEEDALRLIADAGAETVRQQL
jgi:diguanylate cyclase (GGDEF)-like protein